MCESLKYVLLELGHAKFEETGSPLYVDLLMRKMRLSRRSNYQIVVN